MSKKQSFTLQASDAIQKQIGYIGRSVVKLIASVQLCAAQVIAHAQKHGDISLAQSLVDAVPKHHKATLVAFLEKNGPFAYMKDTKKLAYFKRKLECDADWFESLPSWESAKPAAEVVSQYDMDKEASKFLDRMQKIASDTTKSVSDRKLLDVLIEARNRYIAQKYLGDAARNASVSPEGKVRNADGEEVSIQKPALAA